MKIETLEEGVSIIDRAKDLTSKIDRLSSAPPRELTILMHGMRDQGHVIIFSNDQDPEDCIVHQCAQLILADLKAERLGLEIQFKEL